jgi:hypothetical protein
MAFTVFVLINSLYLENRETLHIKRIECVSLIFSASFMGDERYTFRVLVGRLTRRRENNIKTDLEEVIWEVVGWIYLAQCMDHWHVKVVVNLRVP